MPVANPLGDVMRRASIAHGWTFLTTLTLSLVAIGALSVLREQTMKVPAIRTGYQLCFLLALIIVSLSHLRSELADRGQLLLSWADSRSTPGPTIGKIGIWFCVLAACASAFRGDVAFATIFSWGGVESTRLLHHAKQPLKVYEHGFSHKDSFVLWSAIGYAQWTKDEDDQEIFRFIQRGIPLFHYGGFVVPADLHKEFLKVLESCDLNPE